MAIRNVAILHQMRIIKKNAKYSRYLEKNEYLCKIILTQYDYGFILVF